jgi:hypothetical protein
MGGYQLGLNSNFSFKMIYFLKFLLNNARYFPNYLVALYRQKEFTIFIFSWQQD